MSGDTRKVTRGDDRVVVEVGCGVTVYPAREPGDRWRAVWYENGRRRQCEAVSEDRLAERLEKVTPYSRIELIRVYLALADLAGARTLMQEVDELLTRRPGLGTLVGEAETLRARLAKERGSNAPGASALTGAELRLLPLLTTHLSFPEIAAELFLSPHTIKSQMRSIYRKLDATTRHQAVTRARDLRLLEG